MILSIADNLINGNLTDAKRQAKRVSQGTLAAGFFSIGFSLRKSAAAALYLKHPTNQTWQSFCDADQKAEVEA